MKYKGLQDGPILVTAEGRIPSTLSDAPQSPDFNTPMGLYQGSRYSELKANLLKQQQDRVLEQAGLKINELASLLTNMHVPQGDVVALAKTAVSPAPQAISAQADDQAATPASHTVEVNWPAQGRTVLSAPENPVDSLTLADGEHTFSLFIEGVEHQITVTAHNDTVRDTQEEFLARLARAIDMVDPRLKAEVVHEFQDAYDPAPRSQPLNRVVRLKVQNTEEGRGIDYYFSDVEGGNLVETYGLNSAPPRRAASLRVLGQLRSQDTNELSLDDGHVTGQIKGSTNGPVDIKVSRAAGVISQELNQAIVKYNDLVSYLNLNADILRPSLKDRIVRPLEQSAKLFPDIGLRATAQGRLAVSSDFDRQVTENFGQVREVLFAENGWQPKLLAKLQQIQGMDIHDFAAPFTSESSLAERQRARELLEYLTDGIINGYV